MPFIRTLFTPSPDIILAILRQRYKTHILFHCKPGGAHCKPWVAGKGVASCMLEVDLPVL